LSMMKIQLCKRGGKLTYDLFPSLVRSYTKISFKTSGSFHIVHFCQNFIEFGLTLVQAISENKNEAVKLDTYSRPMGWHRICFFQRIYKLSWNTQLFDLCSSLRVYNRWQQRILN
jgi:hypothetical protein